MHSLLQRVGDKLRADVPPQFTRLGQIVDGELEEADAHFVGGSFAPVHSLGWGVRIGGVVRAIVVARRHVDFGPLPFETHENGLPPKDRVIAR